MTIEYFFTENTLATPEQNLLQRVVIRAVQDAFLKNKYYRWDAWNWFHGSTKDYRLVCQLAGIPADLLRQTMIETVFFNYLIQKGGITMKKGNKIQFKFELPKSELKVKKAKRSLSEMFDLARQAKSIFRAIYSQQELDKAIGSLTLNDIIKICKQSRYELEEEAAHEVNNG
jgi:hypothetical protein